jgi:hypothetical protein
MPVRIRRLNLAFACRLAVLLSACCATAAARADELTPLKLQNPGLVENSDNSAAPSDLAPLEYRTPGLAVDLGVGLWAWPVPCDADGDGDYDLIVSCPDKPYNGVWLFENTMGNTAKNKFPVFAAPRRLSKTVHYVLPSYVDGTLRVLSPGFEYPDFVNTGLESKAPIPAPKTIPMAARRRTSPTSTATATWTCCAANSSTALLISRTLATARRRAMRPAAAC